MLYYRKYFIVILALICVLLAIFGATRFVPEETSKTILNEAAPGKIDIASPVVNWAKTANLEKNWLFIEVYNPNSVSADVMLNVYFYQSGIVVGKVEHLYYVSLGPNQNDLLFYDENIPSDYDYLKTEIIFYTQSVFEYKMPELVSEEQLNNGIILDYNFTSVNGSTISVLCLYDEEIVGFSYILDLDKSGSRQYYSCHQSFDGYKIYENFY